MPRQSKNPFQIHFGKKFYKQTFGYWMCRQWIKDKKIYITILAHRFVWENHYGTIQEGLDIHHIDGNKDNNDISNLETLSRSDHRKEHWNNENLRSVCEEQLNKVRPLEWLKSEEGRKAISEKGKEVWENRGYHKIICEQCGCEKEFRRWARFCSKKCYMKWRWINILKHH